MRNLINVIHPHTYKMLKKEKGFTLNVGPCEEYAERDKRVSSFLHEAIDSGAKIMHYQNASANSLNRIFMDNSLKFDTLYKLLFDGRIETLGTTSQGIPAPDIKPTFISDEVWKYLREEIISHSELESKIGKPSTTFFIGGVLENCVENFAAYYALNYKNGERTICVPELCASFNEDGARDARKKLIERGIEMISYDEAINLLHRNNS
ncbi:hypothetical protein HY449_00500 [Candidatus Pacearchaeota archaeon]|nr:hypothetical protein [Candidatus Pacearchaeota archaeon]